MATLLFRDIDPEHFGNPIASAYSVFQVFTVEGWNEIADGLVAKAEDSAFFTRIRCQESFSQRVIRGPRHRETLERPRFERLI